MLEIQNKSMNELRAMAKQIGLGGVKAESKAALKTRIMLMMQPGLMNELNKNGTEQGRITQPKQETKWLTVEEVINYIRPYSNKLQLAFYDENGEATQENAKVWHLKNGPAEDSGSMSVPKHILLIKAQLLAEARFPAKIGRDGGDLAGCLGA